MKVIDLFENGGNDGDGDQIGVRITSREGRKAAKQISNNCAQLGWDVITNCVQAFCTANPDVRDIPTIVANCEGQLKRSAAPTTVGTSNLGAASNSKVIDYSDFTNEDDEAAMKVNDGQDFDELCLMSTSTPLWEVLKMFPNAKQEYVQQLLEKNAHRIDMVVQSMLDKGYEKEESTTNGGSKGSAAQPSTPAVDFTSNSWETSAAYRKDAISELQRNFPFLTQPSIAQYFKREKFHFYHSLIGLEKQLKIPGLYFTQCRVQNIAATLTSGTSSVPESPAIAENSPVGAGLSINKAVSSSSNSSNSKSGATATSSSTGAVTIDLMDSQPQFEVEGSGLFRTASKQPSRSASVQFVEVLSPATGSSAAAGGKSNSKRAGRSSSSRSSAAAAVVKALTKDQLSELRARCDKDTTGLAVKTTVLASYSCNSSGEDEDISYVLQPLDSVLTQEIEYVMQLRRKEMMLADQLAAEKLNEEMATAEGCLMECGCCYGDYAFEALVQCSEGHLFCKTCLQRYCEQTVFGNGRSVLKCMSTAEVCTGFFPDSMLQNSLPEKVLEKFNQALSRDALTAAHMEGLVTCCHCSVQMLLEEDAGNVLQCPYCHKETCRLCGEESHVPLRCAEVEKKGDTSARLSVEEAMTQARLRECLKCKTRFYKTEGCNKMTCRCGSHICYICRKDISKEGYQHFCQTAHCNHASCKKCRLYTDTVEDDRQAMKEAGLKTLEAEQMKAATTEGGAGAGGATKPAGADKPGAKVDLEKLLEEAGKKPPGMVVPGRAHAHVHAMPAAGPGFGGFGGGFVFGGGAAAAAAQAAAAVQVQAAAQAYALQRQQLQQQQVLQQQVQAQARQAAQQQRQLLQQQVRATAMQQKRQRAEEAAARKAARMAEALQVRLEAAERKRQAKANATRLTFTPEKDVKEE